MSGLLVMEQKKPLQAYARRHFLTHLDALDPDDKRRFTEKVDMGLFEKSEAEPSGDLPPAKIHGHGVDSGIRSRWLLAVSLLVGLVMFSLHWMSFDKVDLASFHSPWGAPESGEIMHRKAYSFGFDPDKKLSLWVSYKIQRGVEKYP